jgi:catechol 2,3-dioxygenase-like lactoylglutathione lyase family enzyme
MRILSTHHVSLSTPDIARLRAFYGDTLGLPIVGEFAKHRIDFFDVGGVAIEIEQVDPSSPGAGRTGWNHVAWEVADVDATYAELSARGVLFHVPPEDFPPGAPSMRIAFFADPDGNVVELIQPLASGNPAE